MNCSAGVKRKNLRYTIRPLSYTGQQFQSFWSYFYLFFFVDEGVRKRPQHFAHEIRDRLIPKSFFFFFYLSRFSFVVSDYHFYYYSFFFDFFIHVLYSGQRSMDQQVNRCRIFGNTTYVFRSFNSHFFFSISSLQFYVFRRHF